MGKCEKWTVAYRRRCGDNTILNDRENSFTIIKNTLRYWCADPFLTEHEGRVYLFAERYDRFRTKGVLSCCELNGDKAGKWTNIIELPFHLSYPCVFKSDGDYYLIPESFRCEKILLFKAVSFPYEWEQVSTIADMKAVDSTVLTALENKYLITSDVEEDKLEIYNLSSDYQLSNRREIITDDINNTRSAGNVFIYDGSLIRPSQDCTAGYGCALNFNRIDVINDREYNETCIYKLRPEDILSNMRKMPVGIHTYNVSENYEVIDLKQEVFGFIDKCMHLKKIVFGLFRRSN